MRRQAKFWRWARKRQRKVSLEEVLYKRLYLKKAHNPKRWILPKDVTKSDYFFGFEFVKSKERDR
jgi:hypothetical protein